MKLLLFFFDCYALLVCCVMKYVDVKLCRCIVCDEKNSSIVDRFV